MWIDTKKYYSRHSEMIYGYTRTKSHICALYNACYKYRKTVSEKKLSQIFSLIANY